MNAEEAKRRVKPINSAPILAATSSEYKIAVNTPSHSNTLDLLVVLIVQLFSFIYLAKEGYSDK
jgi:HJR/Mrr/RecB family endonuclease